MTAALAFICCDDFYFLSMAWMCCDHDLIVTLSVNRVLLAVHQKVWQQKLLFLPQIISLTWRAVRRRIPAHTGTSTAARCSVSSLAATYPLWPISTSITSSFPVGKHSSKKWLGVGGACSRDVCRAEQRWCCKQPQGEHTSWGGRVGSGGLNEPTAAASLTNDKLLFWLGYAVLLLFNR